MFNDSPQLIEPYRGCVVIAYELCSVPLSVSAPSWSIGERRTKLSAEGGKWLQVIVCMLRETDQQKLNALLA